MNHSFDFLHLVNDAKTRIQEINPKELIQIIEGDKPFYLIDVREIDEWEKGHIPQATFLPRGILERDFEKVTSDKNALIVVYCAGGYRSALACDALQKMGYQTVFSLQGGIRYWVSQQLSIVHDSH